MDTLIDRAGALLVPENAPGRGIGASKHQIQMALPRIDSDRSIGDLAAGVAGLAEAVAGAWTGDAAPEVRMLPARLPYLALPPRDDPQTHQLAVGIAEQDLAPVRLNFAAEAHVLLFGDSDSGKTGFLRMLARRIVDTYQPGQARLILIDHRRGLLGEVGTEHLLGYGTDMATTTHLIAEAARGMADRLPGPDVTPERMRKRAWWTGPELFILVDDYDLVVTSVNNNPLLLLMEYLPQGRDIGLHVIVTRRTGGASRAMYDPFLSRMRDVGSIGLLLSGTKDEGPLLGGVKAEPLPPGRGRLITRREAPKLVQLAWLPPADPV
jgi:DNA segregation ATPase FtsK/SpoIIIE, S-DNA-T family